MTIYQLTIQSVSTLNRVQCLTKTACIEPPYWVIHYRTAMLSIYQTIYTVSAGFEPIVSWLTAQNLNQWATFPHNNPVNKTLNKPTRSVWQLFIICTNTQPLIGRTLYTFSGNINRYNKTVQNATFSNVHFYVMNKYFINV